MMKKILLFLFSILLFQLNAQTDLLSPSDFLPHEIGEQFTPHHQLVDYYEYVAENSPYIKLLEYGQTNEQRPLILAFVSTPENLAKLDDIRLNQLRRTGLAEGKVDEKMDIAITWLSFGVHGNEAAGSESSMPTLYDLANPANARTKKWLENSIVIIDPSVNPDGYSRYTHWYRRYANKLPNSNLASLEHNEPWPGGRTNHYLFDLNRDWAWATQVESRQRLVKYNEWMPHIHADLHEMGINSPYYFAPAAQPYHEYITQWQRDFQIDIGKNHAKYFDENGWLYFTKEVFDLLYPSYGDTYPTYNGAIGMTYEQGGSGRAGRVGQQSNGDVVTLQDRIAHHQTAALSTVEIASLNASKLNQNFAEYFKNAQENPQGKYKTYIIKGSNPKGKLERLTELLDRHQIKYGAVTNDKKIQAYNYQTGETSSQSIAQNDLIISAYQPKSVLIQTLFDPDVKLVDSLTYDITAWALPYAHGLDATASEQRINPSAKFTLRNTPNQELARPYAYAIRWTSLADAQFLSALLQAGIKARYATVPFEVDGEKFETGTITANRADNRQLGDDFFETMNKLVAKYNQAVVPIQTGFVDAGKDLGSGAYKLIETPRVALIGDEPTYSNSFGHTWYFLEQDLDYPLTTLTMDNISQADLSMYNVLIFPEGRYQVNELLQKKIESWVSAGGRLILIGTANRSFANKSGFALKSKEEGKEDNNKVTEDNIKIYGNADREYVSNTTPGAIFSTQVDTTHPLGYGMGQQYFTLKTSASSYSYLEGGWNVSYINENPMVKGFVGVNAMKKLKESLVAGVQNKGRGAVVYFIDNPLYRGFWEEGKFLFSNALFFL